MHQDKTNIIIACQQFGIAGLEIATNRVTDFQQTFFSFMTEKY